MEQNNNKQLPAEVLEEINENALKAYPQELHYTKGELTIDLAETKRLHWVAGATDYATKAYQAQQEIESLTNQLKNQNEVQVNNIKLLRQENEKAQQQINEYAEEIESAGTLIKENEQLKRWKQEAAELLAQIHAYVHKNMEVELGQCHVKAVIERCKQFDEAHALIDKIVDRYGITADKEFYNEIKTFIDGTK